MLLIILGDGVCANVILNKSKGQNSGWIVITSGWAFAVAISVYAVGRFSGAHLNPAVTVGLATIGQFPWSKVLGYIIAQTLGAFIGAILVWLVYLSHWEQTEDPDAKLGVFCTAPAIRNLPLNFMTELIATFVLVLGILAIGANKIADGFGPFLIGILIWTIGLCLGGPTGYAINPARDLGPRIAHSVLPIPEKRNSDWGYALVPILGPITGGILGAQFYNILFK
jgi:glycerol uptake facilitator protein